MPGTEQVRFGFGRNWLEFAKLLDQERIEQAEQSLRRLCGDESLAGRTFLDIGSGSGLFSLAARRLGALVHSFDFDPDSVACTAALRDRHGATGPDWTVEQGSVLDAAYLERLGTFDIVYSWGVLHHTGAMHEALRRASQRVAPGGLFVFALYRKTRLCWAWTIEKRWYAKASPKSQSAARAVYSNLMRARFAVTGRDFRDYVANYRGNRGMNFEHDVHDWMGGYPYESIAPADVAAAMTVLGFSEVRRFTQAYSTGLFGSGCDEYAYRRTS